MSVSSHYWEEMVGQIEITLENPRALSCSKDEDFQGVVKKIQAKSPRATLNLRSLQRYIIELLRLFKP